MQIQDNSRDIRISSEGIYDRSGISLPKPDYMVGRKITSTANGIETATRGAVLIN